MEIASIERLPEGSDADVRVYHCSACHHEMRLTVWATVTPLSNEDATRGCLRDGSARAGLQSHPRDEHHRHPAAHDGYEGIVRL
jgi:hypothetical protein